MWGQRVSPTDGRGGCASPGSACVPKIDAEVAAALMQDLDATPREVYTLVGRMNDFDVARLSPYAPRWPRSCFSTGREEPYLTSWRRDAPGNDRAVVQPRHHDPIGTQRRINRARLAARSR